MQPKCWTSEAERGKRKGTEGTNLQGSWWIQDGFLWEKEGELWNKQDPQQRKRKGMEARCIYFLEMTKTFLPKFYH